MPLTKPTTTKTAKDDEKQLTEEGVKATAAAGAEEATQAEPEVQEAPGAAQPEPEVQETAQPEPEAQAAPAEESRSTAVATNATGNRMVAATQEMAEDGMEGLNLGGMSFEQIRLPGEGQFLIGQDDTELGKSFQCVIQASRAKYVVKASDERDAEMYYSYDAKGQTFTDGSPAEEKLQEWREDGYDKPVIKKYIEAWAILLDPGSDRDRTMVALSISPSSEEHFAGFIFQQRMMRGLKQNEFITECIVGKKRKAKSGENYFPWAFRNAGKAPEGLF